jgi:hypothetical protein
MYTHQIQWKHIGFRTYSSHNCILLVYCILEGKYINHLSLGNKLFVIEVERKVYDPSYFFGM